MKFLYLLTFFLIISCNQDITIEKKIITKFDKKMSQISVIDIHDFYSSLEEFEKILINDKFLNGNKKKDYLTLISNVDKLSPDDLQMIKKKVYKRKLSFISSGSISLWKLKSSLIDVLKENKTNPEYLVNYLQLFDKMESEGIQNPKTIKDIYMLNSFENKKNRMLMLFFYFAYLDSM